MAWSRRQRPSKPVLKSEHLETYITFQKGGIRLFDLWDVSHGDSQVGPLFPTLKYTAHDGVTRFKFHTKRVLTSNLDAVGSVGFNPLQPLLLSVSGSRNFDMSEESGDSDDDSEDEVISRKRRSNSKPVDTSIKLWNFATPQAEQ